LLVLTCLNFFLAGELVTEEGRENWLNWSNLIAGLFVFNVLWFRAYLLEEIHVRLKKH